MNLRNNIIKLILVLGTLLTSCNSIIYEDMEACEQGVYVNFYTMTPCDVDSTYLGKVSSLHLFAFDENDHLVTIESKKEVSLDQDFKVLLPVSDGYYSFIGWVNLEENLFSISSFKEGITTKREVLFALKADQNRAVSLDNKTLWQGESKRIHLPDPAKYGSVYKDVSINLREVTNRVTVIIDIDESVKKAKPEDFDIRLSSANGTMRIDGTMPLNTPSLTYSGRTSYTPLRVEKEFVTLDLALGYNNELVITNKKTEEIAFRGDLIGSILLNTITNNINLACENDFIINLRLKDKCADCGTYYACEVFVNGWEVHSYEIEF